ncbi:MAG: hypothetical protein WCK47_03465 [bacterium]|nr:hypothetical protein [Candidatus Sumerlaeota bacterium]
MEPGTRYIFRKPLWRKALPFFLLLAVWGVVVFMSGNLAPGSAAMAAQIMRNSIQWLASHGVTYHRALWGASLLSLPILLWWYAGFETLTVTTSAITRRFPLMPPRSLAWSGVDEILIEHTERIMEGRGAAKKEIFIYALPRRYTPWRRCMRINNRQFTAFHHVERMAVMVSVPAIAARKRAAMPDHGGVARFSLREPGTGTRALIYAAAAASLLALWGLDRAWMHPWAWARPGALAASIFFALLCLLRLFYRELAVDPDNIYVMRRRWPVRTIPIDSITEIEAEDNTLRIMATMGKKPRLRTAFRTRHYFPNRAVLLYMIRETQEARRASESVPILPIVAPRQEYDAESNNQPVEQQ